MNATVLAALITGAATLIAGLIGGALAVYFAQRRHNEAREDAARRREEEAQRREEEARRQAEKAHRREAVAQLKNIAETIREMRHQFELEEPQVPRNFGHEYMHLINREDYKALLQPYLGNETQPELGKLWWLYRMVFEGNTQLESGQVEPEVLKEVLAEMQRVEGDVRGQAARISPTESRAN